MSKARPFQLNFPVLFPASFPSGSETVLIDWCSSFIGFKDCLFPPVSTLGLGGRFQTWFPGGSERKRWAGGGWLGSDIGSSFWRAQGRLRGSKEAGEEEGRSKF